MQGPLRTDEAAMVWMKQYTVLEAEAEKAETSVIRSISFLTFNCDSTLFTRLTPSPTSGVCVTRHTWLHQSHDPVRYRHRTVSPLSTECP